MAMASAVPPRRLPPWTLACALFVLARKHATIMNTEWDVGGVTFDRRGLQNDAGEDQALAQLQERFLEFIRTYRRDNSFIYR